MTESPQEPGWTHREYPRPGPGGRPSQPANRYGKEGSPEDRRNWLGAVWAAAPAMPPRTLIDILEASVRGYPDAPALDADGVVLSYRELWDRAGLLARDLAVLGVGVGDRVGVQVPSGTVDLYTAVLTVLRAGASYVPVDAEDPDRRAAGVWADAEVCAVIGERGTVRLVPGRVPCGQAGQPRPADDAWVIFTSGTSGRPKGVAVTHRAAAAFVDAEAQLFLRHRPPGPGDRVLARLSVAFDASCEEMWLAWRHGACLVPAPYSLVRAGADLGPWLLERGVTVVSTVPTLAALWPAECLTGVRLLVLGGEACPADLVDRLAAPQRELWNTYGPTETTVVACAARLVPGQPVRIGAPLAGCELAVVGPDNQPVAWGEIGELVIGGVGTARYLDPAKDAEKFQPHPFLRSLRAYRSGDLVRADPLGLVYVGRADEQVKLSGRRVELGEIDAALQSLPGVRAAAAAIRATRAGGQVLVGYLVLQGDGRQCFDTAAARVLLLARLPQPLVPLLAVVDGLPTRTSGKVDRDALPWPLLEQHATPPRTAPGADPGPTGTAGWLADLWESLLGLRPEEESEFFALGGTSLSAAQLVSTLRERVPGVSVTDVYQCPRLLDLAARLDELEVGGEVGRTILPTPRWTGAVQLVVVTVLCAVVGIRLLIVLAVLDNLLGPRSWAPRSTWWLIAAAGLALYSAPGRVVIGAAVGRLLTAGFRPGTHPRGGSVHLRLWAAERMGTALGMASLLGTHWAARYAKALGCAVGQSVDLHAMPPVTGMARFGSGCVLEPEADAAGWWLDGDVLHLGRVEIGDGARVGARSMLMPGAKVGSGADVAPGSCVDGEVPADERWYGSPARRISGAPRAGHDWPQPVRRRSRRWELAYSAALSALGMLPLAASLPALLVLNRFVGDEHGLGAVMLGLLLTPLLVLLAMGCYATLTVVLVRLAGRVLTPGYHPTCSRVAWCAWLVSRLMGMARTSLFPFYAGLLTPLWLRLLGARVGRQAEVSTVLGLPALMRVGDQAFLADDTLVAPFELRGGWLRLDFSCVGRRAFVGNSGIVRPGRELPRDALVGVLSDVPAHAEPGSSWLGRPGFSFPRVREKGDPGRTWVPPRSLVLARAAVETCRLVPIMGTAFIGSLAAVALQVLAVRYGLLVAAALAGVVMLCAGILACLATTTAKWLVVGRFRTGRHPLWSSFVWRNELYDTFVEELAMPWLGRLLLGTPFLNLWLRSLGARIGRGVWCETHWLPETDLVRIGDGASVNRGCVVQTHVFHDRVMQLDQIRLDVGATLGPRSIALPGASLAAGTVVGPASLVMRGERVPARTRWLGNPIAPSTPASS
ncbi:Pls/PosA family non-ribosomal peptide synthetase [Streptomyces sp. NPDC057494]|uniref:Pls/PosA family non-ribosomal peptide synthetase n=1 Tax=Streptomyces sp. NPDC057494 TaxID=3346148 RepID=UPI003688EA6C